MSIATVWNKNKLIIVFWIYILFAVIASLQALHGGVHIPNVEGVFTGYNNYIISKYSFFHLINNKDLYIYYLNEHWDLYKYSPAFSLLFGMFAYLPDGVGLILWNAINALCLYAGVKMLSGLDDKKKTWILLFCLIELLGSMQNSQSNALVAGLIILSFGLAEKSKFFLSALCIAFSFYIKLYGAAAFALYLFYPNKLKLAAYSFFWMMVFAILPLAVISSSQLLFLYKSWWALLSNDQSASIGLSVMSILQTWFHSGISKNIVMISGLILFCLPFLRIAEYKSLKFRMLMLSSLLIWMVIFNHKAESPTYIIAIGGIAIWFFSQEFNKINLILLILTFIFTTLSVGDLFPSSFRESFIKPYAIKAVLPCLIWLKITIELLTKKYAVSDESAIALK
ncbi:MAG TPA: glycosyltransferase family 87 protein [Puia sp.]|nr:glycosyltransferase family 87 protein [Puia sp.]